MTSTCSFVPLPVAPTRPPPAGTSAFTPGAASVVAGTCPTPPATNRPRMGAATVAQAATAPRTAAEALHAAGGVDPITHHVAATLRRHTSARADAAASDEKRSRRPGVAEWSPVPNVKCGTSSGGGWVGGAAAVAADAAAKRATWAAEMAALRGDVVAAPAPVDAPVPAKIESRPLSWAARQARLREHAASVIIKPTPVKVTPTPVVTVPTPVEVAPTPVKAMAPKITEGPAPSTLTEPSKLAKALSPTPAASPLEVAASSLASPAPAKAATDVPVYAPRAAPVPVAASMSLAEVLSPAPAPSLLEAAASALAAAAGASTSDAATVKVPSYAPRAAPATVKTPSVAVAAPAPAKVTERVTPRVIHVRSAWGKTGSVAPVVKPTRKVIHVHSSWRKTTPAKATPVKATSVKTTSVKGPAASRVSSVRVKAPVSSSTPTRTAPVTRTAAPVVPDFVSAALTGVTEPASVAVAAPVEEDDKISAAMRTLVTPALTMAFVGACLALSHVGAVIGAGLPLN